MWLTARVMDLHGAQSRACSTVASAGHVRIVRGMSTNDLAPPSRRSRPLAAAAIASTLLGLAGCSGPARRTEAPPKATLAFDRVRVFDGKQTWPEATVLVDGDKIVAVTPGGLIPSGVELIDGRGKTLLPGLIDAHVHASMPIALEQSLAFGVTTVLDMFAPPQAVKQARDGKPGHADILTSGILATAPGGHGTEYGFEIPTLTKPEEAQAWVDARIAEGSDYIKIVFDGGSAYGKTIPTLDTPTFAAVVAAAHARGKLAVVHVGDLEHAQLAVEHGADGLVHLFRDKRPSAGFGALAAGKKAFVTPTLVVTNGLYGNKNTIGKDTDVAPYLDSNAQANLNAGFPIRAEGPPDAAALAIAQLRDAGVDILAGTDAPNPGTAFGASLHEELSLLVAAGLSPTQALTAATAAPAARFGLDDRGRVAPGLLADLLLVDGDPTHDIAATRKIAGIWKSGQRFDRDGYRKQIAAAATYTATGGAAIALVSDFEASPTAVSAGQPWTVSTDEMMGGTSKAKLVAAGGAHGSKGALEVSGELVIKGIGSWSGALWMPGARPFEPLDFSSKKGFSFQARGDGKVYTVLVFSQSRGRSPAAVDFTPGKDFATVSFTWSQFEGLKGNDIAAIFIGQTKTAGAYQLVLDDFQLQ